MKKIIVSIILCFIFISQSVVFSQYTNPLDHQLISTNIISTSRIKFINAETGYIGINDYSRSPYKSKILKTTNKGLNWNYTVWEGSVDPDFTFEFINENELRLYHQKKISISSDGGISWYAPYFDLQIYVNSSPSRPVIMKFLDASNGYIVYFNSDNLYRGLSIFRTNDGGQFWSRVYSFQGNIDNKKEFILNDFAYIGDDPNHVFFVGYYHSTNFQEKNAFFTLETTDGGATFDHQSGPLGDNCSYYQAVTTLPNASNQKRFILTKYNYVNSSDPIRGIYCKTNDNEYKINNDYLVNGNIASISFSDNLRGFLYISDKIYKTDNSGTYWTELGNSLPSSENEALRINSFGDVAYALSSNGNLITKHLSSSIKTVDDKQVSFPGGFSFIFNGMNLPYPTPFNYYINGGATEFHSYKYLDNDSKLFYKWGDNYLNPERNLNVFYDNFSMNAQYKTKLKADNDYAIYNSNQTKAIRDTNGTLHQIHESLGGIFYSNSTDNGGTFQKEEAVNSGFMWNIDFPNDVSATENRNPSLCEIRNLENGKALSISCPNLSVAATWQHFNSNGNMEIKVASRVPLTNGNYDWNKFKLPQGNSFRNGIIRTFSSQQSFQSKPVVFSSTYLINGQIDWDPYYQFLLVPHLESVNGVSKLFVTAMYKNLSGQDNVNSQGTNNFQICKDDEGNISDYAVTAEPMWANAYYKGYRLFFTYIAGDGKVYHKANLFTLISGYGGTLIVRDADNSNYPKVEVSSGDNLLNRYSPDISLRNGRPVVTYKGYKIEYRSVQIENGSDEPQLMVVPHYPIIVKYKDENGWASRIEYDGFSQQYNPNIEGSKNADAYILNYKKNDINYQFVKINGISGYCCSPGNYPGQDAKLIKGSYFGQFGTGSTLGLLALSYPTSALYSLERKQFGIVPCNEQQDGFSNMDGTIEKDNMLYSLTLGPIIASNTTYGFEDDTPPQTVQNAVEFNETMVSAVFSLSNNDTLILGAHGKYLTSLGIAMQPLKYHVNLVNSSNNQIHRELFRDTINFEDSIGIEFLRGFIINNIAKGTDQFYVQMVVDTVDAKDGNYDLAGVYADATPPGGDAPQNYKTKVFFENTTSNTGATTNLIPKSYELSQNYPNPFNPSTTIKFALPKDGFVTMKVYDLAGREVAKLVSEVKKAGYYQVQFNASSLASGVYFYRIQSNDFVITKRMVLIK